MFSFNAIYMQLLKENLQKPRNGNSWVLHPNEHVCQRSPEGFGFRVTTIVHESFMFSFK